MKDDVDYRSVQLDPKDEFTLVLTVSDINALIASTQELPARVANPLVKKIDDQMIPQIKAIVSRRNVSA